ncbi:hypothetical protein JTE90_021928 [Oedothorax gibbosus]|uniref:Uncharacterized protein n=1 Tax=Oedothorax gibbosus TaxID=931172 RepID=A0AAV6VVM6_9ARAC|nr:hypothetical protein JTE90_021928 [Oedothorax gibbosus]
MIFPSFPSLLPKPMKPLIIRDGHWKRAVKATRASWTAKFIQEKITGKPDYFGRKILCCTTEENRKNKRQIGKSFKSSGLRASRRIM